MAYVKVRNSGRMVRGRAVKRYQAKWTEDGRAYADTFDTREAAEDRLRSVKMIMAQGNLPTNLREAGKTAFASVASEWLAGRHDLKPATRAEYTNLLADKTRARRTRDGAGTAELSIAATFGARPVNSITRADIADWVGN